MCQPFTFPFFKVGVGGLEPPTSASQTRRAGRLRYTPRDNSIIRSMWKGQASQRLFVISIGILSMMGILMFGGCYPSPQQATQMQPSSTTRISTATIISTSTRTATATKEKNQTPEPTLSVTPTFDCLMAGGSIQESQFYSDILGADFFYRIYLPPCYDAKPNQRYPVAYLLHGLSYDSDQWLRLGLEEKMNNAIRSEEIPPFIVVMPQEARFDSPPTSPFDDVLVDELIPYVEDNFRTLNEKSHRAIGGISRGAAWAVRLGFEHHALFAKVGAHSLPLFESDISRIQAWLTQTPKEDLPLIFIDIGRDDLERASAFEFAKQLDQYGIPHEWYLFNDGHTENYWSAHLGQYLRWYAKDW